MKASFMTTPEKYKQAKFSAYLLWSSILPAS
jgi:hypothetical protein